MTPSAKKNDLQFVKGVGERRLKLFSKLSVDSIDSLLRLYPRSYISLKRLETPSQCAEGENAALLLEVISKNAPVRISGGRTVYKLKASGRDDSIVDIVYFNDKYTPASLRIGKQYIFYGKPRRTFLSFELTNPVVYDKDKADSLIPKYPSTAGLSSKVISKIISGYLTDNKSSVEETIPENIRIKYDLVPLTDAYFGIHMPKSQEDVARAKKRLIFEELLALQLALILQGKKKKAKTASMMKSGKIEEFISSLPFSLTKAQLRCIEEIKTDISKNESMNRLLQGDVGSGKTVVSAAGVWIACKSGFQSAVMAPTEVLANQHFKTFKSLLDPLGVRTALLTSSITGKNRQLVLKGLKNNEIDLVVGTHALIGETVEFNRLGFVTVDEQHRFGVEQRNRLYAKGDNPHFLSMSATPIPRTLSLLVYGDLDISVLDEMPPGRKPVKTYLVDKRYRSRYLNFVVKNSAKGNRTYIVCPLVEESEAQSDVESAVKYVEDLSGKELKSLSLGLIHGKLKSSEKEKVMQDFSTGKISVLISTTVIEVGLDVPEATVIIIENSEYFGLSTLHQLRGRVGRGDVESHCILVSSAKGSARKRLKMLTQTNDGFEIAKFDLLNRGPGDLFGSRQHGLPEVDIEDLFSDENIIYGARETAEQILKSNPELKGISQLKSQVFRFISLRGGGLN
ncbi:MAG: ATP-dependent DNA helicase RecG [Ruminococcaceae bacterium]|nr:ATP-dependent DNA helicase RecG [Oscillospiraceae bacterium]